MNKHIEAAAAAIADHMEVMGWDSHRMAQAAITAYHESLASAGEDGVVEAMLKASSESYSTIECTQCDGKGFHHGFGERGQDPDWCSNCDGPGYIVTGDEVTAMRAALAVARAADAGRVAELQRSHDMLCWLIQHGGKAFYVLGDWWIEWMHNGVEQATATFNTLEDAMAAARATEGGGHE